MKSQIRKPAILASGLLFVNNDSAYIGINNETYKILTEIVSFEAGFNVTLLDDTGATVKNQQVTCTTNSQQYTTDSSGKISETIYYEGTSLTFTWKTLSEGVWQSVSGVLEELQNITTTYTAIVNGGEIGNIKNITSNKASKNTQTSGSGQMRINNSASVGDMITIGSKEYIIVDSSSPTVAAILRYWEEDCQFDASSNTYSGSDIAQKCQTWYTSNVPLAWRNYATTTYTDPDRTQGISATCYIPSEAVIRQYWRLDRDSMLIFRDESRTAHDWWTSSKISGVNNRVVCVSDRGNFTSDGIPCYEYYGFRPVIILKRSLFIS